MSIQLRPKFMNWMVASGVQQKWQRLHVAIYEGTGGRLGPGMMPGARCCLLSTVGRKSGLQRTLPLIYVQEGDVVCLVASNGGAVSHPLWYRNLVAHPDVTLQIGRSVMPMVASTADLAEKERYWPWMAAAWPQYDDYQTWTEREIPLVLCRPLGATG